MWSIACDVIQEPREREMGDGDRRRKDKMRERRIDTGKKDLNA